MGEGKCRNFALARLSSMEEVVVSSVEAGMHGIPDAMDRRRSRRASCRGASDAILAIRLLSGRNLTFRKLCSSNY